MTAPKRGGARKGAGRPPSADKRARTVKVSLTERTYDALQPLAEEAGVSVSELLADLAEDAAEGRRAK